MKHRTFIITGTDTAVGKTVLTCLLARHFINRGETVAALKPICSGGRDDAEAVRAALRNSMPLDVINPWHFRAAIAPKLAARSEGSAITLNELADHIRAVQPRFSLLLVEGAGGLMSPLGEDFDTLDLIAGLRAVPVIVCPDKLGAINQTRLVMKALPRASSTRARVVLMSQQKPDLASKTNASALAEIFGKERVHALPWIRNWKQFDRVLRDQQIRRVLNAIIGTL